MLPTPPTEEQFKRMADSFCGPHRKTVEAALDGILGGFSCLLPFSNIARGFTVRDMRMNMLRFFPYQANQSCLIPKVDMQALAVITGEVKVNDGNRVFPVIAARHKHWQRCPVAFGALYFFCQFSVVGTRESVGQDGKPTTLQGQGFLPILDGKAAWYNYKVSGVGCVNGVGRAGCQRA